MWCFFHPDRTPVDFDSKLKSSVEKHNAVGVSTKSVFTFCESSLLRVPKSTSYSYMQVCVNY